MWGGISVILLGWAGAVLSFPFGRDQGILAWAGSVILKGGAPYRDAWDVKGPLAMLPFTAMQFLTGHNMWGIRLFDLLMVSLAAASAAYAVRIWFSARASVYAVFLLLFVVSGTDFWLNAQPDGWCGYALTGVIALLASPWRGRLFLAAASVGLCTMQKPVYCVYLLLFVPILVAGWRSDQRVLWGRLLSIASGFLGSVTAVLAWLASRGALTPFIDTYIRFNFAVHTRVDVLTPGEQFRGLVDYMGQAAPFALGMPLAIVGGVLLSRKSSLAGAIYWTWLLCGFLVVILQMKYLYYHWYPAMCTVAFGAAITIHSLRPLRWRIFPKKESSLSAGTAVFLWLAFVFLPTPAVSAARWASLVLGHTPRTAYYDTKFFFRSDAYFSYPHLNEMSAYIRNHSTPADTVEVWGWDPLINYLSERSSPTRFGYNYPLLSHGAFRERYRQEFIATMTARPPLFIAIAENDTNQISMASSAEAIKEFPAFEKFLHARYRLEKNFGYWELWREL